MLFRRPLELAFADRMIRLPEDAATETEAKASRLSTRRIWPSPGRRRRASNGRITGRVGPDQGKHHEHDPPLCARGRGRSSAHRFLRIDPRYVRPEADAVQ